MIVKHNS